jgi:hypothetical protein
LIRSKGFGEEFNSWVPEGYLNDFLKAELTKNPVKIVSRE